MTRPSLPTALLLFSALLTLFAVGWWWIVFDELVKTGTMSLGEVVPCMVRDSDICSLAQSLCRENHFLNIRRYFVQAFWIPAALFMAMAFLGLANNWQGGQRA